MFVDIYLSCKVIVIPLPKGDIKGVIETDGAFGLRSRANCRFITDFAIKCPVIAPINTSADQCLFSYILERPVRAAREYTTGGTHFVSLNSMAIVVESANAMAV